jgi:selenocysteine-specific elongation factor
VAGSGTGPEEIPAAGVRPLVVGTSGHIDHGKTSLVLALTGIDTDRLPAEQERGISIDLGFAHLEPEPGLLIAFVDVPGHERFVKNMLAGATGIDAVLFVVAADEGLMPQSREHFDIVRLLGIERILAVVTKIDAADRELIDIVRLELDEYLSHELGRTVPVLEVSARTGEGLDALRAELVRLGADLPERNERGAARLPIDRRFVLQGHGTIVTGTQSSGSFAVGDSVEILPARLKARVRELQSHGRPARRTGPGQRVAMKLHGVSAEEISRGDVVTAPGTFEASSILNVHVRVLAGSPMSIERRTRLRVHLGSAEVLARAQPLEGERLEPGQAGFVQLRLESPAVAVGGQALVLRRYSPALTIAGGSVLESPAPKQTHETADLDVLRLYASGRAADVARAMTLRSGSAGLPEAALAGELHRRALEPVSAAAAGLVELAGGVLQVPELFARQREAVLSQLAAYHEASPLEAGARPERLLGGPLAELQPAAHAALLQTLERHRDIAAEQDRWRLTSFAPILDERSKSALDALVASLDERGPVEEALLLAELKSVGPRPRALLQYLQDQGLVLRMGGELLLGRRLVGRVLAGLRAELASPSGLGVTQLKDRTGWTRKLSIPFLELTDSLQLTRRRGDLRFTGPALAPFLEGLDVR